MASIASFVMSACIACSNGFISQSFRASASKIARRTFAAGYSVADSEPSMTFILRVFVCLCLACLCQGQALKESTKLPPPQEGDYTAHNFHFHSGESMPELRLHYLTFGKLVRDANGHVSNAVLLLHGTGGSGRQFLEPQFADVLFGPGQLLDINRYFIVLDDGIGHGKSSKPSEDRKSVV